MISIYMSISINAFCSVEDELELDELEELGLCGSGVFEGDREGDVRSYLTDSCVGGIWLCLRTISRRYSTLSGSYFGIWMIDADTSIAGVLIDEVLIDELSDELEPFGFFFIGGSNLKNILPKINLQSPCGISTT